MPDFNNTITVNYNQKTPKLLPNPNIPVGYTEPLKVRITGASEVLRGSISTESYWDSASSQYVSSTWMTDTWEIVGTYDIINEAFTDTYFYPKDYYFGDFTLTIEIFEDATDGCPIDGETPVGVVTLQMVGSSLNLLPDVNVSLTDMTIDYVDGEINCYDFSGLVSDIQDYLHVRISPKKHAYNAPNQVWDYKLLKDKTYASATVVFDTNTATITHDDISDQVFATNDHVLLGTSPEVFGKVLSVSGTELVVAPIKELYDTSTQTVSLTHYKVIDKSAATWQTNYYNIEETYGEMLTGFHGRSQSVVEDLDFYADGTIRETTKFGGGLSIDMNEKALLANYINPDNIHPGDKITVTDFTHTANNLTNALVLTVEQGKLTFFGFDNYNNETLNVEKLKEKQQATSNGRVTWTVSVGDYVASGQVIGVLNQGQNNEQNITAQGNAIVSKFLVLNNGYATQGDDILEVVLPNVTVTPQAYYDENSGKTDGWLIAGLVEEDNSALKRFKYKAPQDFKDTFWFEMRVDDGAGGIVYKDIEARGPKHMNWVSVPTVNTIEDGNRNSDDSWLNIPFTITNGNFHLHKDNWTVKLSIIPTSVITNDEIYIQNSLGLGTVTRDNAAAQDEDKLKIEYTGHFIEHDTTYVTVQDFIASNQLSFGDHSYGDFDIKLQITDPEGYTHVYTVNAAVQGIDDVPVLQSDGSPYSWTEDQTFAFSANPPVIFHPDHEVTTVTLTCSDLGIGEYGYLQSTSGSWDSASRTFTITGLTDDIVNTALANLEWVPNQNFEQNFTITLSAADAVGSYNLATLNMNCVAVNDPPTIIAPNQTFFRDGTTVDVDGITVGDVDAGDILTTTIRFWYNGSQSTAFGDLQLNGVAQSTMSYDATNKVMTLQGTVAQINADLGILQWVVDASTPYTYDVYLRVEATDSASASVTKDILGARLTIEFRNDHTWTEDTDYVFSPQLQVGSIAGTFNVEFTISDTNAGAINTTNNTMSTGVLSITGDATYVNNELATLTFYPNNHYDQTFTVSWTVTNDTESESGSFTMNAVAVPDVDIQGFSSNYTYTEDTTFSNFFGSAPSVGNSIGTYTVEFVSSVDTGTWVTTNHSGSGTTFTFNGDATYVNNELANLSFEPHAHANNNFDVTVNVTHNESGDTDSVAFSFTGVAVHDVALSGIETSVTYTENTDYTFSNTASVGFTGNYSVTITLSDNMAGSVSTTTYSTTNGTVTFTGSETQVEAELNSMVFEPRVYYSENFTIDVVVTHVDSGDVDTVTIAMAGINIENISVASFPSSFTYIEDTTADICTTFDAGGDGVGTYRYTLTLSDNNAGELTTQNVAWDGTNNNLVVEGTKAYVEAELATLDFVPAANYNLQINVNVAALHVESSESKTKLITTSVSTVADFDVSNLSYTIEYEEGRSRKLFNADSKILINSLGGYSSATLVWEFDANFHGTISEPAGASFDANARTFTVTGDATVINNAIDQAVWYPTDSYVDTSATVRLYADYESVIGTCTMNGRRERLTVSNMSSNEIWETNYNKYFNTDINIDWLDLNWDEKLVISYDITSSNNVGTLDTTVSGTGTKSYDAVNKKLTIQVTNATDANNMIRDVVFIPETNVSETFDITTVVKIDKDSYYTQSGVYAMKNAADLALARISYGFSDYFEIINCESQETVFEGTTPKINRPIRQSMYGRTDNSFIDGTNNYRTALLSGATNLTNDVSILLDDNLIIRVSTNTNWDIDVTLWDYTDTSNPTQIWTKNVVWDKNPDNNYDFRFTDLRVLYEDTDYVFISIIGSRGSYDEVETAKLLGSKTTSTCNYWLTAYFAGFSDIFNNPLSKPRKIKTESGLFITREQRDDNTYTGYILEGYKPLNSTDLPKRFKIDLDYNTDFTGDRLGDYIGVSFWEVDQYKTKIYLKTDWANATPGILKYEVAGYNYVKAVEAGKFIVNIGSDLKLIDADTGTELWTTTGTMFADDGYIDEEVIDAGDFERTEYVSDLSVNLIGSELAVYDGSNTRVYNYSNGTLLRTIPGRIVVDNTYVLNYVVDSGAGTYRFDVYDFVSGVLLGSTTTKTDHGQGSVTYWF